MYLNKLKSRSRSTFVGHSIILASLFNDAAQYCTFTALTATMAILLLVILSVTALSGVGDSRLFACHDANHPFLWSSTFVQN